MLGTAILCAALGAVGAGEFLRPFEAKAFDQAALDAEGFAGDKAKALARDESGLRVTLAPGDPEAGWKAPPALRLGGDFTISAVVTLNKLPKPAQDDGAAIGLAISTQDPDQPDATLLREVEADGRHVFRPVEKAVPAPPPMMNMNRGMMNPFAFGFGGGPEKPPKPVRHTFPAKGSALRLELVRQGPTLRYQVYDENAAQAREVGQFAIGAGDIAGLKLFASNRSGAGPVEVVFRSLSVQADRVTGLGTSVRTVYGQVILADPTALDGATLVVGGPPPTPAPAPAGPGAPAPAAAPAPREGVFQVFAPEANPAPNKPAPTPQPAAPVPTTPAPTPQPAPTTAAVAAPAVAPPAAPAAPAAATGPMPAGEASFKATPPAPPAPKARVPLDEVESITFERAATPAARFQGQPNVDATRPRGDPAKEAKEAKEKEAKEKEARGKDAKDKDTPKPPADDLTAPPPGTAAVVKVPKLDPEPNGIRDIHLDLSGLREAALTQVVVQCQTDKGQTAWQLDTTGALAWPLSLRRAGLETWADLFLEPPPGDCFEKEFNIVLTYGDGQNANLKVKATGHTDPKLAFDPAAPAQALDARVYLAGDEQLFGKLEAIDADVLSLKVPWGDLVKVPLPLIAGVYMGMPDHKETAESFAKRLKARGSEDLLLARAKDGEVVAIGGVVEGSKANKLTFAYQGKPRTLPLKQVEGFVMAARNAPAFPSEVRPTFALNGGLVLSGRWAGLGAESWQVKAPWGQTLKLPAAEVRTVRFRGGQMTYLSDLEPSRAEEVPYFGRPAPFRKDVSLNGGPLRLDGKAVEKGLAVHSRSALTYDLDRRYATFEAVVGFDDSGKKRGRVDCRVFADGKELYANPDLRADAPPVTLNLAVTGAERLKLVVDYGPDEDTGDRVIWAHARLYKKAPPATPAPARAASTTPSTPLASGR